MLLICLWFSLTKNQFMALEPPKICGLQFLQKKNILFFASSKVRLVKTVTSAIYKTLYMCLID